MARCTGQTVVLESPTIPTFANETEDADEVYATEVPGLSIDVGDVPLCACGELTAVTFVIYDGTYIYNDEIIYSATLST